MSQSYLSCLSTVILADYRNLQARSRLKEEFARGMDVAVAGGDVAGMHRYGRVL